MTPQSVDLVDCSASNLADSANTATTRNGRPWGRSQRGRDGPHRAEQARMYSNLPILPVSAWVKRDGHQATFGTIADKASFGGKSHSGIRCTYIPARSRHKVLGKSAFARSVGTLPTPAFGPVQRAMPHGLRSALTDGEKRLEKTEDDRDIGEQSLPGALGGLPAVRAHGVRGVTLTQRLWLHGHVYAYRRASSPVATTPAQSMPRKIQSRARRDIVQPTPGMGP